MVLWDRTALDSSPDGDQTGDLVGVEPQQDVRLVTSTTSTERVCIVLPTWLGDTVMATPLIRSMRELWPRPVRLIGVGRPVLAQLLDGTDWFDEYIPYDRDAKRTLIGAAAVRHQLTRHRIDTAVLLPNSFTSAWFAWRAGIPRRIGFARQWRSLLLTDRVAPPGLRADGGRVSQVDEYIALAQAVGAPHCERRLELATNSDNERVVDEIWDRFDFHSSSNVILLNFGAATCTARRWPTEYCVAFARRVVAESSASLLLLCGPGEERETAALIEREVGHPRVRSMADQDLSLGVSKAVIRRGDLLVTTDSGPRHIAAAFARPTLGIFGPTDPTATANYNPGEQALTLRSPCFPCRHQQCPLGHHRCIRELTPEFVANVALRRLSEATSRRVA